MKIAINGAGIAGPTLAYWLRASGHEVLLVEQAPRLRSGGYIVDFWGVGYDVAERMGLKPRIREVGYQVTEVRFVDRQGRRCGGFRTEAFIAPTRGRFTSILRSDLAAAIYGALDAGVETIFADSIAAIDEKDDRVTIGFDHASARDVDLVVGADGLHSRIRALAFGPESTFEAPLGYHVAAFEVRGYRPRDELVYVVHGEPGRQISRFAMRDDTTLFLFVFRDEYLGSHTLANEQDQKSALADAFAGVGWECPRILTAMERVSDVYFDRVSQIRMGRWTKGRIALIGDAAACVSLLAGEGSGLAMAEAYVLAGELGTCAHDYSAAFARYERRLMPFLERKQRGAAKFASHFAPATRAGIALRNLATELMRIPVFADLFVGSTVRDDVEIPHYRNESARPTDG